MCIRSAFPSGILGSLWKSSPLKCLNPLGFKHKLLLVVFAKLSIKYLSLLIFCLYIYIYDVFLLCILIQHYTSQDCFKFCNSFIYFEFILKYSIVLVMLVGNMLQMMLFIKEMCAMIGKKGSDLKCLYDKWKL